MKRKGTFRFVIMTVCLVFVNTFFITGTVFCQSEPSDKELENYYQAKEHELVKETRSYLNQEGFRNSGVTLTKVINEDGCREYTVTVHHEKIDKMDNQSRENLREELATLVFATDNCYFSHEFLVTD